MDWSSVTFDWNQARAFLVSAEEGSFSAAARALGLTQPTVGRQVAALEAELGVTLFERVGRGLQVTEAGLGLVEHVRAMGEAAARVSLAAAGQSESLEGLVAITASEVISGHLLPPALLRLRAEHPGIEIDLVADNAIRDLRQREADVAVRNVRPDDPQLVARRLPDRAGSLYATPALLAALGHPTGPEGFGDAPFLAFDRTDQMLDYMRHLGFPVTPASFPLATPGHLVQWQLCCAGLGVGVMMTEVGDPDPRVVRILDDLPPVPVQMWLTAHRELRTSRRVRVVFDVLAEVLAEV